ncbi:MAG: LLM class flavin-dependent oxidoreductase [Candidatus Thorarchaeota archaeon]|nr:LLM class flavin-dependent oxidoreductase [Candidatus Thorarchaeota archaeon]
MNVNATSWIGENADSLGIDGIWVGEDIGIGQETSILTADLLSKTRDVRVGTGIVPITIHNIATIARAALTLHEIGNGRYVQGVGVGGIQDLIKQGKQLTKPVTELRKATQVLRQLFKTESVTIQTELMNLNEFSLRINEPVKVPIFYGVRGPQMLKLAGKIADGVILSGPIDYIRYAIEVVDEAALNVGRSKDEIEKVVWLPTIPTFKGGSEKLAKRVVALVVADTPEQVLDLLDIDHECADKIRKDVAESGPKEGAEFVNQQFIDTFAISGTCTQMVDKFELIHDLGATEVVLGPPFSGEWREAMTEIFQEIHLRRDK